ncbi:hypothetical protein QWY85_02495 [Neolewinella lacunae]|uniref:Uncharacterized protein n=1 Tax=Neolewinella lacunae TaxID=1517758 RepID=A0A923PHC7_9BACT|nr:hypothetical protein [Neolewinella lacunae]MBC6992630.1 hypothetical protein [Neolewinella lacunae]MDN3633509.1 hypothetical protein [Neolewinella lacunae]
MFKSNLLYLFVASVLALSLFSCESENSVTEGTVLSDDISPVLGFPERIPADSKLNTLMMSGQTDWGAYDKLYREDVLAQSKEVYFDNLQWATISFLMENTDFLASAPTEDQLFYLTEISHRDFVNQPGVAVSLLKKLQSSGIDGSKLASAAREILAKNKNFLTDENYKKHEELNSDALKELFDFGYDRWAREK